MAQDQHKWTFPKFWKSSKHDGSATERGRNRDTDSSTPKPEEKHRFQIRKSSSQSSLFQTKRNSRPTEKTITDDRNNDPEWVPFHRSSSPRLKSNVELLAEMKGRLAATSPIVDEWRVTKDQSMLDNGRTFDHQMSLEKKQLLATQRTSGGPRMLGNDGTSDNQSPFPVRQSCDTGEHLSRRNVDSATVSPMPGGVIICRNGQQMTASRRLFDENKRQRHERPRSCEHVLTSTFVHGVDGQNGLVRKRMDESEDTAWKMRRQPVDVVAVGRMDSAWRIRENQLHNGLTPAPGNDNQEITRQLQGESIKERFRITVSPVRTASHLETNGAVIGTSQPQQDMTERINYVQVGHASPVSGQHPGQSSKLVLIEHCHKGGVDTGNEGGALPAELGKVPRGSVMSSAGVPAVDSQKMFTEARKPSFPNNEVQIGNKHVLTDFRSNRPDQYPPDGSECPIPRQMAKVATHGDVRGDSRSGIVQENTAAGSRLEPDPHKMDIYGRRRVTLPWELQAENVRYQPATGEMKEHGLPHMHQSYRDRSPQIFENYQMTCPQQRALCLGTEKQLYGKVDNGMTPSSQTLQFSKGQPMREQNTRTTSCHKLDPNQGTSDRYDERVRIEEGGVRFVKFMQQPMPGFRQASVGNKGHIALKQSGYKPVEACGTAKCRSPQEMCTISTTSQDSGFEQRMQHLVDSQNQSQMSSILETSVSTPPVFVSGDSGNVKEYYYGRHQRRPVETGSRQVMRIQVQSNNDLKHRKSKELSDSSSEDSDSDGSSDLFIPKSQSQYDLTKSYRHRNHKTTTDVSLRAKSHNNVWPRRDDLSASDGEQQSMAKSSLVLLHSSDFVSAVNMAHGGQHHEGHQKHHHSRRGGMTAKQEQIRKFKSAENVISAKQEKQKSVHRLIEGGDRGRTMCDDKDVDRQEDVSFDGKFTTVLDYVPLKMVSSAAVIWTTIIIVYDINLLLTYFSQ